MTGFKNFVMRGNLVELAVAVVIGTQFSSLVKQFVSSFIDPLLSLVGGTPDLGKLVLHVGKATFTYGQFLTEALTFLISALVVYYAMVLPVSRLLKLLDRNSRVQPGSARSTVSIPACPGARRATPVDRRDDLTAHTLVLTGTCSRSVFATFTPQHAAAHAERQRLTGRVEVRLNHEA